MSVIFTIAESIGTGARRALPYGLMAFFLMINGVAFPIAALSGLKAPLFLMGLYYWSVYRPSLIPPWMAFVAGIIADMAGGMPLGINAAIFLMAQWIITDQRRFLMAQPFVVVWFVFLFVLAFAACAGWILFGVTGGGWAPVKPLFYSSVLGMILFPAACILLHATHRILPDADLEGGRG
jgi:rod shape-determining protein MreD